MHQGYLEPASYAQGLVLTVVAKVSGSLSGNVGESTYIYAVINSEQLYLCSPDSGRNQTRFHLGVGIGL